MAGLYELPNVEGNMGQEEVLSMVKEMGYAPIRIQPLGEAKHIFFPYRMAHDRLCSPCRGAGNASTGAV